MNLGLHTLRGWHIRTADGARAELRDLYFDDRTWRLHYLIVSPRGKREGPVLVTPNLVRAILPQSRVVEILLTQDQLEACPEAGSEKPVSQQCAAIAPAAGVMVLLRARLLTATTLNLLAATGTDAAVESSAGASRDSRLRSWNEIARYRVVARDGAVGWVRDLLLDSETWRIESMVVLIARWPRNRQVVLALSWIRGIHWATREVQVCLKRATIQRHPAPV